MKFYAQMFLGASDQDLQTIFAFLKDNCIAMAVEVGPINQVNGCGNGIEGTGGVATATALSQRVQSLGGELAYVAMDEPLYFGHYSTQAGTCQLPIATLASNVEQTFVTYQSFFAAVQMGDIEPFMNMMELSPLPPPLPPLLSTWAPDYASWMDAFTAANGGIPLAFVHDDTDYSATWKSNLPTLLNILAPRGVPYGLIHDGYQPSSSSLEWMATAEGYLDFSLALGSNVQHNIFQTWNAFPQTALPETSPTAQAFLVDYVWPPSPQSPGPSATLPIYRSTSLISGDVLYSTSTTEGTAGGYVLAGAAFNLFQDPSPSRSMLYRCFGSGKDHFISLDPTCEGQPIDGPMGYVETALSTSAPHPLYRCFDGTHHFVDLPGSILECVNAKTTIETTLGFVP
jgi:hypothetical protein